MRYVLGFAFSSDFEHVALIEKTRPAWQAGKFNGIGGKIEGSEDEADAIVREFAEETGLLIPKDRWKHFIDLRGVNFEVHCFVATTDSLEEVRTMEDEEVVIFEAKYLPDKIISNLSWLVPLARNFIEDEDLNGATALYGGLQRG